MLTTPRRIFLVVLGLAIVLVGVIGFDNKFALLGLIPVLIGATGFCPACYFFGRCKVKFVKNK